MKPAKMRAPKETKKMKESARKGVGVRRRKAEPSRLEKGPAETKELKVGGPKGRPMLTWVGKRPLAQVVAFPAQHIESFTPDVPSFHPKEEVWTGWPTQFPKGGLMFHGDNIEVLAHLLANGFRGKVKLIYIDPPFDSGADYVRKVQFRGGNGNSKLDGETYTLGEQVQYSDIWANDKYLQFMYERLLLLKELLCEDGTIYLHTDWHKTHLLRCLMDEVFGSGGEDGNSPGYKGEVVWCYKTRQFSKQYWNRKHQSVLFYSKGDKWTFNWASVQNKYSESTIKKFKHEDDNGKYRLVGRGIQDSPIRSAKDVDPKWEIEHPEWVVRDYLKGGYPPNDWMIIDIENQASLDRKNYEYPTMKPSELIRRLIRASSTEGDLVLDCFIGSGTTAAVAQQLGRRWIACDINKGAIHTTKKRLQSIIYSQIPTETSKPQIPLELDAEEEKEEVQPAQLSYSAYRVNDYDLHIQHHEVVSLVCEHIGVSRTNDSFFDGTRGKALVKIVPVNHPLGPIDIEDIKRELKARPTEDRDVVVVCLGKENSVDSVLNEWNRLRKKGDVPNRIDVIELRTDQKYGRFIRHEPPKVRVKTHRKNGNAIIEIEDYVSPTIVERLSQEGGVVVPKIGDWRCMVDYVMIDTNYDGKVFNIAESDIPQNRNDLVTGKYELPIGQGKSKIAVKIVDMLGEEAIDVKEI